MEKADSGTVFNIQRFSTHDGPGIRTVVFLKGCHLRCAWCSNPESNEPERQVMFNRSKCIGCGTCQSVCPSGIAYPDMGSADDCRRCSCQCAAACPSGALEIQGKILSADCVFDEIMRDSLYYANSGGGITLSGGEPLLQPFFCLNLLERAGSAGIHTAVETTGAVPWDVARPVLERCSLVLYDLKHMDDEKHRQFTGVSNRLILRNAERCAESGRRMIFRVPLIGGANDDEKNISETGRFALKTGVREIHLLPYHRLGEPKYDMLRRTRPPAGFYTPDKDETDRLAKLLSDMGLSVSVGG